MQFALHPLLEDEVLERELAATGLRRRFDIAEAKAARRNPGEKPGKVIGSAQAVSG